MTAVAAQKLVETCSWDALPTSTVYTSGLLLDIGVLVVAYLFPDELDRILAAGAGCYFQVGQNIGHELDQSHYHIGYILLKRWQLPAVYQSVLQHFDDIELSGAEAELISFLKASRLICGLILDEGDVDADRLVQVAEQVMLPLEHLSTVFYELVANKENVQKLAEVMGR